jgi:hypothetical protein
MCEVFRVELLILEEALSDYGVPGKTGSMVVTGKDSVGTGVLDREPKVSWKWRKPEVTNEPQLSERAAC